MQLCTPLSRIFPVVPPFRPPGQNFFPICILGAAITMTIIKHLVFYIRISYLSLSPLLVCKPFETSWKGINWFFSACWLLLDTLLSAVHILFHLIRVTPPPDKFYG